MRCDLGVMISASHNPFEDNGIKLFGPDGFKLSDEVEARIEALMDGDVAPMLARSPDLGRAKRVDDVQARYIEYAKRTLNRDVTLDGLRIVVDCPNGAAYKVAPRSALGARRRSDQPWQRRGAQFCPKELRYTDFADLISHRGRSHLTKPARKATIGGALGLAPHRLRPAASPAAGAGPRKALAEAIFPCLVQDLANA
jgi:hypothetical protein